MQKFLISLIGATILISTACYYNLGFYLADWDMHAVMGSFWAMLLVITILPLALTGYEKWNWLIFYLAMYILYCISIYFDAEKHIVERIAIIDSVHHGELFFMLNSTKFLIGCGVVMLILAIILKILEKKSAQKFSK